MSMSRGEESTFPKEMHGYNGTICEVHLTQVQKSNRRSMCKNRDNSSMVLSNIG
jgi:hypothetical protein